MGSDGTDPGGGGGGGTSSTHTGRAAGGAPLIGATVAFKDQTGAVVGTTLTDALGGYAVTLDVEPPFMIKTTGGFLDQNLNGVQDLPAESDATFSYYSFASTVDQPANLTPLTTAIFQSALGFSGSGLGVEEAFGSPSPSMMSGVQLLLENAHAIVLGSMGLGSSGINLIETPFDANGTGIDALLDSIGLGVTPTQVDLLNDGGAPVLAVPSASGLPTSMGFFATLAADVVIGTDNVGSSGDLLYPGPGFAIVRGPIPTVLHDDPIPYSAHLATGPFSDVHTYWTYETMLDTLRIRRSVDGGASFEPAKDIVSDATVFGGDIATDSSGNVYVASWDWSTLDVFARKSTDGGATYGAPITITSGGIQSQWEPVIATDPAIGRVYVAWYDWIAGANYEVFVSSSSDGGAPFSSPVNVSLSAGTSFAPYLAVDSTGVVYVAWHEIIAGADDVFLARSVDGGATFSTGLNITNTAVDSGLDVGGTGVTIGPGNALHITWVEAITPGIWNPFFMKSEDGGSTFSAPTAVLPPGTNALAFLHAWVGASNIVILWSDQSDVFHPMFLTMSGDGGATFSSSALLWSSPNVISPADLAVDGSGDVHVIWQEHLGIIDRVSTMKLRIK